MVIYPDGPDLKLPVKPGEYRLRIGYWRDPTDRPTTFTAKKENGQVLRVLYPPAPAEKPRPKPPKP